jgi:thiamine kinase-like enzyme
LYQLNLDSSVHLPISCLLLRIYGAGTENLIDRKVELSLLDYLTVYAPEIAPCTYVAFTNGRLEQFITGVRTLQASDMREASTSVLIARKMARLHSLPLPPSLSPQATVWIMTKEWLNGEKHKIVEERESLPLAEYECRMQTVLDASALMLELQPLVQNDPTVLCHNDLLCGNILQELGNDRLFLIDYECVKFSSLFRCD